MSRNYQRNIVDEFLNSGYSSGIEFIDEECYSNDDFGAILRDSLDYLGSSEGYDQKAKELLGEMLDTIWEDDYESHMFD